MTPLRLGVAENWTRGHEGFKPLAYTAQFGRERTKLKGVGGQWRASRPHSSCTLPLCRGSTDEKTFGCEFPVTSSADVNQSDALESRRRDCFFGVPLNSVVVRSVENSAFVSIASEKILLASPAQRFCAFQNEFLACVGGVSSACSGRNAFDLLRISACALQTHMLGAYSLLLRKANK